MSGRSAQNDSEAELRGAGEHDFFFIAVALHHPNACKTAMRRGPRLRARVMPKPGADPATLIGQPVKITQVSSR
jgi:hypothetical protein